MDSRKAMRLTVCDFIRVRRGNGIRLDGVNCFS